MTQIPRVQAFNSLKMYDWFDGEEKRKKERRKKERGERKREREREREKEKERKGEREKVHVNRLNRTQPNDISTHFE